MAGKPVENQLQPLQEVAAKPHRLRSTRRASGGSTHPTLFTNPPRSRPLKAGFQRWFPQSRWPWPKPCVFSDTLQGPGTVRWTDRGLISLTFCWVGRLDSQPTWTGACQTANVLPCLGSAWSHHACHNPAASSDTQRPDRIREAARHRRARRVDRVGWCWVPVAAADRGFRFAALQAVILNKAMSLVVVASALPFRAATVPFAASPPIGRSSSICWPAA